MTGTPKTVLILTQSQGAFLEPPRTPSVPTHHEVQGLPLGKQVASLLPLPAPSFPHLLEGLHLSLLGSN